MIATRRLELVPATRALLRAALASRTELAAGLGATVNPSWPHEYLDDDALRWVLECLGGPGPADWGFYFIVRRSSAGGERCLIGSAGYKTPPSAEGALEIGYGIVSAQQRRGYASEAVQGLLARAFAVPQVRTVLAETLPELTASIGVLHKAGFRCVGPGSEPGVIRYALAAEEHSTAARAPA